MTRSRAQRAVLAIITGVLLAFSAVIANPSYAATPPPTPAPLPPLAAGPHEADLQQLVDLVAKSPDQFAGISTTGLRNITIHTVGTPALPSAVQGLAASLRAMGAVVTVKSEKYSARELEQVQNQIPTSAIFAPASSGLSSWFVDAGSNSVDVHVTNLTPALKAQTQAQFGDKVVLSLAGAIVPLGRTDDYPPLYGGDRITGGPAPGTSCTSGFAAVDVNGNVFMVTAGHCFTLGTTVSANTHLSSVSRRSFTNLQPDEELLGNISGSPTVFENPRSGYIWDGPIGTQTSRIITNSVDSCTGCQVYFGGSYTGTSLATLQGSKGGIRECLNDSCSAFVNVTNAQEAVGQNPICQHGDSGGPVYAFNSTGITAVGIITAIQKTNGVENTRDCFYTSFRDILNKEGVALVHS